MESIARSLPGEPVLINAGLLREPVRYVAKYQSPEICHADQLRHLRVRGSDTSATGRTALLHPAVHFLSLEHRETAQLADLFGSVYDVDDQFRAILPFHQNSVLLGGSALHPAHYLVKTVTRMKNMCTIKEDSFELIDLSVYTLTLFTKRGALN